MKKTVILGVIAALLLTTVIVSVTVHAHYHFDWWQPEWAKFRVYGTYECIEDEETDSGTGGNIVNVNVFGKRDNGKWTGRGIWIDRDYDEGVLVIKLVFDDGWGELGDLLTSLMHPNSPDPVIEIYDLFGDAHISVNGKYRETSRFRLNLFDTSQLNPEENTDPDEICLTLLPDSEEIPSWYKAFAQVLHGDIITMNPEYPGIIPEG